MIFVFLGPCNLINDELCRFCQGKLFLIRISILVSTEAVRNFLIFALDTFFDISTFQGLHINLVQHSAIVLLLSFAYRLYILGGDVFAKRRTILPIHVWFACMLSLALMALPIVSKNTLPFEIQEIHHFFFKCKQLAEAMHIFTGSVLF